MDAPFRRARSARQGFLANIERYRKEASLPGGPVLYNPKVDGTILDRLCADDPRMHNFWGLAVELPNDGFDWLVDAILTAAAAHRAMQVEARNCRASLAAARYARDLAGELWRVLEDYDLLDPRFPRLTDCLLEVKSDLDEMCLDRIRDVEFMATSRKEASTPHRVFMAEVPDILEGAFGKPHLSVVADLVDVLYDVRVDADAVRKARARGRAQEQEARRRAGQFEP